MQNQQPLPDSSTNNDSNSSPKPPASYHRNHYCHRHFTSHVQALTRYQEQHGHMNVTIEENKALYHWISEIKNNKSVVQEEGPTPRKKLTSWQIEMLQQIGFKFPDSTPHDDSPPESSSSNCRPRNDESMDHLRFKSFVELLKQFEAKHGHMKVTTKDKSLYYWMANIRSNYKRIQKGLHPHRSLPQYQIDMLRQIDFDFKSEQHIPFESRIEALRVHQAKHGHMNVSRKENKSLHNFIKNVRQSAKKMQEGKSHSVKFTLDRIAALEEIGFNFRPKRGRTLMSGTKRANYNVSKEQLVEDINSIKKDLSLMQNQQHLLQRATIDSSSKNHRPTFDYSQEQFESLVKDLKQYQAEHGHMNVTLKDKRLFHWIESLRSNYKRIQQGLPPHENVTSDQIDTLRKIGFDFKLERQIPFQSRIEALKYFQIKHGHMNVPIKEDKSLHDFIKNVRQSVKLVQKGKTPIIKLTPDRMTTLKEIGFIFKPDKSPTSISGIPSTSSESLKRKRVKDTNSIEKDDSSSMQKPQRRLKRSTNDSSTKSSSSKSRSQYDRSHRRFKLHIDALKQYQAEHGHMNVTTQHNKRLYFWIASMRSNYKRMQQGLPPHRNITPDQMDTLRQIGFDFKLERQIPFEARIEALRVHQEKHGHMNVPIKENKSLHNFVRNVRQSVKKMREGKTPIIKLTPDRIATLEEIGFNCGPNGGGTLISGTRGTSCDPLKRQEVEERLHDNHKEMHITGTFTSASESEDMEEEIEGDIIPRWVFGDEKEEDNDDSLLDEIAIKIDDGAKVECTSSTPIADICRS